MHLHTVAAKYQIARRCQLKYDFHYKLYKVVWASKRDQNRHKKGCLIAVYL